MMNVSLCVTIIEEHGSYINTLVKNKIIQVFSKEVWDDVAGAAFGDADQEDRVNNAFEDGKVTVKLRSGANSNETFEADFNDCVSTILNFNNNLKYVTMIVKTTESEVNNNNAKSSKRGKNAFDILMPKKSFQTRPPKLKSPEETLHGKHRLYNRVCEEMNKVSAEFPLAMPDDVITKHVATIVNVLWYLDGNKRKIVERSTRNRDVQSIPDRFLHASFDGFNDWKKKKHKAPSLEVSELEKHSSAIFHTISCSFTAPWGDLKADLEKLALSLTSYASFLKSSNESQQKRQRLEHPVRMVGEHAYLEHRPTVDFVQQQYSVLDSILAGRNCYSYLLFDEEKHTSSLTNMDSQKRFKFLKNLNLSVPIDVLSYNPGGSVGSTFIIWRTSIDRGLDEVMRLSIQVYERVRPFLPEFHTRQMRKRFVTDFCNLHAVEVPPAVLRTIYSELTCDASVEQNKQVENRIRRAILTEDPDLVTDLRHINTGHPNDTFDTFFDKLSDVVEEITAADDRRQNVEHMSHFVSVRDLIKQVTDRVPNGTNIPSESTVLLAFVPRDSHKNVSKLYKSRIPLQFKVQTRQLRVNHMDDHYCAAIFKYLRQYGVKYRDNLSFLCVDDKSKVDFGEPGLKVATGVRGKKSITPVQSTLSALDHDMQSKGSFTPSVCLEVNVPHKKDESFYRGTVHVTYKDSIFQASSPWRHATEIKKMLEDKAEIPECLILYSDGGPDHRITYGSVKLSLIVLFKKLNLDLLVAARTAPGHSWLNPAERIMSVLNIAVQNVALSREECPGQIEQVLKSANSMSDIRKKTQHNPEVKNAWMESVKPMQEILEDRTNRLMLKGQPFQVHNAAPDDDIQDFENAVLTAIPGVEIGKYQERFLASKEGYKKFLEDHCRQRSYLFQVRKCDDLRCCRPRRGDQLPWVPDPILKEHDPAHYQDFEDLLGKDTTEKDKPSAANARATAVAEQIQGIRNSGLVAQNVRMTKECFECEKPRCIYSKHKLPLRDLRVLDRALEKFDYSCGSEILPDGFDRIEVCVRMQMDCNSPVEFAYYAQNNTVPVDKTICCYCAAPQAEKDKELLKKYRVVLPICMPCKTSGKAILKRNPIK